MDSLRELHRKHQPLVSPLPHDALSARLIERAGQAKIPGLGDVLKALEPLRFRFWKPSLVLVAKRAREVRAK